jgi:hypothetical protein
MPWPMKPRLQFSLLCLGVDESKGPPSFLHVFQVLPAEQFPFRFPPGSGFFVVSGWVHGEGEHTQATRILAGDGTPLADSGEQAFKIAEHGGFMLVQFFEGMEFPEPGAYRVEIALDGEAVLEYPLVLAG